MGVRSFVKGRPSRSISHGSAPLYTTLSVRLVFLFPSISSVVFQIYCKSIEKVFSEWIGRHCASASHTEHSDGGRKTQHVYKLLEKESQKKNGMRERKGPCLLNNNALSLCVCVGVFLAAAAAASCHRPPLSYWPEECVIFSLLILLFSAPRDAL